MKKLFRQRISEQGAKEQGHGSFLGKVFVVGRHTVTVEEVIAEGKNQRHLGRARPRPLTPALMLPFPSLPLLTL